MFLIFLNAIGNTLISKRFWSPIVRQIMNGHTTTTNGNNLSPTPPSTPPSMATKQYTTIAIEGNIGSGKTTFLHHLQHFSADTERHVQSYAEPIDRWRDVRGHNLFQLLAEDVNRWCFPFQSYVQLSMLEVHQSVPTGPDVTIKLMERSLHSARHCFVENLYRRKHLRPEEYAVLDEWYQWIVGNETGVGLDLIIYLRTDPEVAFERIRRRDRLEENGLTIDYLRDLHELHDQWLIGGKSVINGKVCQALPPPPAPVIVIDANQQLADVKRVYDRHSVDILNGDAFKHVHNVCKQY